jgi:signal transduction histidine kinase
VAWAIFSKKINMLSFFTRKKTAPSLSKRLFLLAFLGGFLVLALSGLILAHINKQAVEHAFDRRLNIYIRLLVADLTTGKAPHGQLGKNLSEPLFEIPQSGWYWQILRVDKGGMLETYCSTSLIDWKIPFQDITHTSIYEGYFQTPDGQELRLVERRIDIGERGIYHIMIAAISDDIVETIRPFNQALLSALFFIGLTLMALVGVQVHFGLLPLKNLATLLVKIRNGELAKLEGNFPQEITPLTSEMNALISHNQEIVERARTHVGNLAHALKTPISVLKNESSAHKSPLEEKVQEQTSLMQQQIAHHLERAKHAARVQFVTTLLDVETTMHSLAKTLEKVHQSREIKLMQDLPQNLKWRGEANDFYEIFGNILDNACKWAKSRVLISVDFEEHLMHLIIEDDGKGVSQEQLELLGKRGNRLDETKPGSGLGLAIAKDLVSLYRGKISFMPSNIGGLKTVVSLTRVV